MYVHHDPPGGPRTRDSGSHRAKSRGWASNTSPQMKHPETTRPGLVQDNGVPPGEDSGQWAAGFDTFLSDSAKGTAALHFPQLTLLEVHP